MSTRKKREIPAGLEKVRRRFEDWRGSRTIRTRIPDPLWTAAVGVAEKYGVHRTAKTLRVDYYGLKKRVEEEATADASEGGAVPTFLELAPTARADCCECILELEDAAGARMRVHLNGVAAPDLAALSRSFWSVTS